MTDVCFSGGAVGADTLFGELAAKAGHHVCHYHFNPKFKNRPNFKILTETELGFAAKYLLRANKTLKRRVPHPDEFAYNLLARNYYQVRDTTCVYAVGTLWDGKIQGGTAWAIQMFIDCTMDPTVFFFDQMGRGWLSYDKMEDQWCSILQPAHPHGYYTGIGTRGINEEGEKAIRKLFTS